MADQVKFITPRGIVATAFVNEPSTKFKAEGKYSCKVRLKADELPKDLIEKLDTLVTRRYEEEKQKLIDAKKSATAKKMKLIPAITKEIDEETSEETGYVTINAGTTASGVSKKDGKEWKRSLPLFDAKGKPIDGKKRPNVSRGSEVKMSVVAATYFAPAKKDEPASVGVTFYLEGVQVLKLVEFGAKDAKALGFGEEEGYEFSKSAQTDEDDEDEDEDEDAEEGDSDEDDEEF